MRTSIESPARAREFSSPAAVRTRPPSPKKALGGPARRRSGRIARIALAAVAGVVVLAVASVASGGLLLKRQVSTEVAALFASGAPAPPGVLSEAELSGLPAPVQRWLRNAQVVGKERPAAIRL